MTGHTAVHASVIDEKRKIALRLAVRQSWPRLRVMERRSGLGVEDGMGTEWDVSEPERGAG